MITYDLLARQPGLFKQFTGLSPAQFEALLAQLSAGHRRRFTLQKQLLMTLMWRRLSLNTTALGYLFGVDRSTASRATRQIQARLSSVQPRPSPWPAPPRRGQGKGIEQALADYPALQAFAAEQAPVQSGSVRLPAGVPPFQNLPAAALQAVTQAAQRRRVARHGHFFHQGDPATLFYILIKGRARLTEVTPEGQQLLVRFVSPGEAIGIIAAMEQSVYPLAAQALEDCIALTWDSDTLERLMERFPRIAINGLRLVAQRWHELEERYRELATERVERRIAQTLLRLVHQVGRRVEQGILIDLPLTRQDLAEMTGTTLYTVSRIISRWEDEQLVETARERILIRYPHGLTLIAEDLPPDSPASPTDLSPDQIAS
ncbi:MAG: hypothetical protein Kow0031_22810 [Anaerolineae bacterium]